MGGLLMPFPTQEEIEKYALLIYQQWRDTHEIGDDIFAEAKLVLRKWCEENIDEVAY